MTGHMVRNMTGHTTMIMASTTRHTGRRLLGGALTAAAVLLAATGATAQQYTLDPTLQKEIFSNIDARLHSLEQTQSAAQPVLEGLASDIAERKVRLDKLPSDNARRDLLAAEITHLTARFILHGRKLVDAAIEAVGGNLRDLDRLAKHLRTAGSGAPETLQQSIERNVATGRAMHRAMVELAMWAKDDPALSRNFAGLKRILATLDTRISTERRLAYAAAGSLAQGRRSRYEDYLEEAIDELADTHLRLETERQRLDELREETLVATQTGELKLTRAIAERVVPGLGSDSTAAAELPGLTGVMDIVVDLNAWALTPEAAEGAESGAPSRPLDIPEFRNF